MLLIKAAVGRKARIFDAFRRAEPVVPSIQAAVDRKARIIDAFRRRGRPRNVEPRQSIRDKRHVVERERGTR